VQAVAVELERGDLSGAGVERVDPKLIVYARETRLV